MSTAVVGSEEPFVFALGLQIAVRGLAWSTTTEDLLQVFTQIGNVVSADVKAHEDTGRSRGWGTVLFETPEQAQAAIEEFDGYKLSGQAMQITLHNTGSPFVLETVEELPAWADGSSDSMEYFGTKHPTLPVCWYQEDGGSNTREAFIFEHNGHREHRLEQGYGVDSLMRERMEMNPDNYHEIEPWTIIIDSSGYIEGHKWHPLLKIVAIMEENQMGSVLRIFDYTSAGPAIQVFDVHIETTYIERRNILSDILWHPTIPSIISTGSKVYDYTTDALVFASDCEAEENSYDDNSSIDSDDDDFDAAGGNSSNSIFNYCWHPTSPHIFLAGRNVWKIPDLLNYTFKQFWSVDLHCTTPRAASTVSKSARLSVYFLMLVGVAMDRDRDVDGCDGGGTDQVGLASCSQAQPLPQELWLHIMAFMKISELNFLAKAEEAAAQAERRLRTASISAAKAKQQWEAAKRSLFLAEAAAAAAGEEAEHAGDEAEHARLAREDAARCCYTGEEKKLTSAMPTIVSSDVPDPANTKGPWKCSACGVACGRAGFSKSQQAKGRGKCRCKTCISNGVPARF